MSFKEKKSKPKKMSVAFKRHINSIMSDVDDIKDKISDKKYLSITKSLNLLFKLKQNCYYKINFLEHHIVAGDRNNHCRIQQIEREQVILLHEDDHKFLMTELKDNKNYLPIYKNYEVFSSIYEQLNFKDCIEIVGNNTLMLNDLPKVTSTIVHLEPGVIITGCKKVI